MEYALNTWTVENPGGWGGLYKARALCDDGQVRAVRFPRGGHADTFFSVPAVVTVRGRTVTGYVTVSTVQGYDTPTDDDPAVVKFHAYGKNHALIEGNES